MLDSAAIRDSTWHSRDFEAHVLVDVLRLSRLTVLYGAEGVGKTTLLKTGVLPLLQPRADDRSAPDHTSCAITPLSDLHTEDDMAEDRSADIAIIFDRWDDAPLTALRTQILDTLPDGGAGLAVPLPDLGASLAAWNRKLGVHFFIILDCFEQYLRAPRDRADIAEFDDEFVRAINAPGLGTHFLLSVRDDAEALLSRFRGRINGFGDAFLRLPSFNHVTAPSQARRGQTHQIALQPTPPAVNFEASSVASIELPQPSVGAATSTADSTSADVVLLADSGAPLISSPMIGSALHETALSEPVASAVTESNAAPEQIYDEALEDFPDIAVTPAERGTAVETGPREYVPQSSGARPTAIVDRGVSELKAMSGLRVRGTVQPTIHERLQLYKNSKGVLSMPKARGAATGALARRPRKRNVLRGSVRRFTPITSLAIAAGLVIGVGAGYFMVPQSALVPQTTSSLQNPTPLVHAAEPAPVPVIAAAPSEPLVPVPVIAAATSATLVPSPPAKRTVSTRRSVSPPQPPTPANKPAVIAPKAEVPATVQPRPEAAIVLAAASDWQSEMRKELDVCRRESFLSRVVCTENVRWKHCAPNRWNSVAECAVAGNMQSTSRD